MEQTDNEQVVRKSITVRRDRSGAFQVWTEQIGVWWPRSHTLSGDPLTQIYLESMVGGRFFERTSAGVELVWGEVVVWEPPNWLAYTWHLGASQAQPTRVDVRFVAIGAQETKIEIEHRGPELIGDLWWLRKGRFAAAWDQVLSPFADHFG